MKAAHTKARVRLPVMAGTFYPAKENLLRDAIAEYVRAAQAKLEDTPKALIAPHAGYKYSGPIAGSAFALLSRENRIRRVVMLGPSHHVEFTGLALSEASAFATPLGEVPLDLEAIQELSSLPQVRRSELPHENEHCLEVELPFLQEMLGSFTLVPLLVGEATDEELAEVIEKLWSGPETLFVISSDLSHYLDYESARKLDRETAHAIEQLRPEDIGPEQACGRAPIRGWLTAARRHHVLPKTLDLRSSGDISQQHYWVVGYGAFAFTEQARA